MRFDILNRLDIDHECGRQTDGQMDRTAVSNSAVIPRSALIMHLSRTYVTHKLS